MLAEQTGYYQQARAHRGLAEACDAAGQLEQASRHWQHALDIFTDLGVPRSRRHARRSCLTGQHSPSRDSGDAVYHRPVTSGDNAP
jgi:hypothetical protein